MNNANEFFLMLYVWLLGSRWCWKD